MTTATGGPRPPGEIAEPAVTGDVITSLQRELRRLFVSRPINRALVAAIEQVGRHFGADHVVVHARFGQHLLSEEWTTTEINVESELREAVNTILWEALSSETASSTELDIQGASVAVLSAVMYDEDTDPSGGVAMIVHRTDADANEARDAFVGIVGFLSLLISGGGNTAKRLVAERREIRPTPAAEHPVRLAFAIVAEIKNRYGFDLNSVGFVRGDRVDVVAISGLDDVSPATPGVRLIRAAMEECLDRGDLVVHLGRDDDDDVEDECRLHAQWSASLGGDPVASFPLRSLGETVAVVSMSRGSAQRLDRDRALAVAEEMSGYANLVPLSRAAARGLWSHAIDSVTGAARRLAGRGVRRAIVLVALFSALLGWLTLGTMQYTFTVPCVVKAADRRTVSCPRDGVLAELFVRPGDYVREGQLLAVLDANDDFLRRDEIRAEIDALSALSDQALADRATGQLRIHEAGKRSMLAQLAVVEAAIERAQIRAPQPGLILDGDLREQLGARLTMGEPMFEIARYDRAVVVLRVPEKLVLAASSCEGAEFSPSAAPDRKLELQQLAIAPASTVVDEANVFLGEAIVLTSLEGISPGMEGVAHLTAGWRPVWWVLTHRLTDWARLNFWL